MKQWMKFFIPAAMAGGMLAGTAAADPRLDAKWARHGGVAETSMGAPAKMSDHLASMKIAITDKRIHAQTQAQMAAMKGEGGNEGKSDQGQSNGSNKSTGSQARASVGPKNARDVLGDAKADLSNKKIHIQTQAQQAAFGYDGSNDRGDNDTNSETHAKGGSSSTHQSGAVVKVGGGDTQGDDFASAGSANASKSSHAKASHSIPGPSEITGPERMHLNANQSQQLTSSRPSEEERPDRQSAGSAPRSSGSEHTSTRAMPDPHTASFVADHADHFKMPASKYH